jgi:signal transduction histidine kinase
MLAVENWESATHLAASISQSTRLLRHQIENITCYLRSTECSERNKIDDIVSVDEIVRLKTDVFKDLAQFNNNTITYQNTDNFTVKSNNTLLSIIIHNILDNANKYTRGGQIEIAAKDVDGTPIISIKDTGIGMPGHLAKWLENVNKEPRYSLGRGERSGLGLVIVKELSLVLNIELKVSTECGTCICLKFKPHNVVLC